MVDLIAGLDGALGGGLDGALDGGLDGALNGGLDGALDSSNSMIALDSGLDG